MLDPDSTETKIAMGLLADGRPHSMSEILYEMDAEDDDDLAYDLHRMLTSAGVAYDRARDTYTLSSR